MNQTLQAGKAPITLNLKGRGDASSRLSSAQLKELKLLETGKYDISDVDCPVKASDPITMESYFVSRTLLQQIKQARESAGLTLANLAKLTGMQTSAISRLENGRSANPSLDTIVRLAQSLNLRVNVTLTSATKVPQGDSRRKRTTKVG